MAWYLVENTRRFITAATVAGLALFSSTAAASDGSSVRGGAGTISSYGVGSHQFDIAHAADIRAFAGIPNYIQYENKLGVPVGSKGATWEIWTYRFSRGGYVDYSFRRTRGNSWLFVQIDTNRKQFKAARGTRVGMSYAEARSREVVPYMTGCIDSGFWHFRDGHRYAVVVGVNPGQSVHALHAYGPGLPLC